MSQQGDSQLKVYSLTINNIFGDDQVDGHELGGACSIHGKDQKSINFKRRHHLENLNKIHLGSIYVFIIIFIIIHYFLLHVSTHLRNHQGESSARKNRHENTTVYPHYSV